MGTASFPEGFDRWTDYHGLAVLFDRIFNRSGKPPGVRVGRLAGRRWSFAFLDTSDRRKPNRRPRMA